MTLSDTFYSSKSDSGSGAISALFLDNAKLLRKSPGTAIAGEIDRCTYGILVVESSCKMA